VMLQVNQPQAFAMIQESARFRPLLLGAIPPSWFIVRPDKRPELERLLTELGFALGASWKPVAPERGAAAERPTRGRKPGKRRRPEE